MGHHTFSSVLLVKVFHMLHLATRQTGKYLFTVAIYSAKNQGPIANRKRMVVGAEKRQLQQVLT